MQGLVRIGNDARHGDPAAGPDGRPDRSLGPSPEGKPGARRDRLFRAAAGGAGLGAVHLVDLAERAQRRAGGQLLRGGEPVFHPDEHDRDSRHAPGPLDPLAVADRRAHDGRLGLCDAPRAGTPHAGDDPTAIADRGPVADRGPPDGRPGRWDDRQSPPQNLGAPTGNPLDGLAHAPSGLAERGVDPGGRRGGSHGHQPDPFPELDRWRLPLPRLPDGLPDGRDPGLRGGEPGADPPIPGASRGEAGDRLGDEAAHLGVPLRPDRAGHPPGHLLFLRHPSRVGGDPVEARFHPLVQHVALSVLRRPLQRDGAEAGDHGVGRLADPHGGGLLPPDHPDARESGVAALSPDPSAGLPLPHLGLAARLDARPPRARTMDPPGGLCGRNLRASSLRLPGGSRLGDSGYPADRSPLKLGNSHDPRRPERRGPLSRHPEGRVPGPEARDLQR